MGRSLGPAAFGEELKSGAGFNLGAFFQLITSFTPEAPACKAIASHPWPGERGFQCGYCTLAAVWEEHATTGAPVSILAHHSDLSQIALSDTPTKARVRAWVRNIELA